MSAPKYCNDPDHCTYSDCPTAFCDKGGSTHSLQRPCSPASSDKPRLLQAVEDFVWNVEHNHVAGWGDCSRDVRADNSFRELKAAMAEAQGNDQAQAQPPTATPERKGDDQ